MINENYLLARKLYKIISKAYWFGYLLFSVTRLQDGRDWPHYLILNTFSECSVLNYKLQENTNKHSHTRPK